MKILVLGASGMAGHLITLYFKERGYEFLIDSPTNQQFIILTDDQMKRIGEKCRFCFWERVDDNRCAVRFATSFATTKEDILALSEII